MWKWSLGQRRAFHAAGTGINHGHVNRCVRTRRARSLGHRSSVSARAARSGSSSAAAGSGSPERHWNHFLPLGTRFRPTLGTVEPKARPHRSKWHDGLMAIRIPMWSLQHDRRLQGCSAVRRRGVEPNMVPYPRLFFTLRRSRGATGRSQGATGAAPAAARRPRRRGASQAVRTVARRG